MACSPYRHGDASIDRACAGRVPAATVGVVVSILVADTPSQMYHPQSIAAARLQAQLDCSDESHQTRCSNAHVSSIAFGHAPWDVRLVCASGARSMMSCTVNILGVQELSKHAAAVSGDGGLCSGHESGFAPPPSSPASVLGHWKFLSSPAPEWLAGEGGAHAHHAHHVMQRCVCGVMPALVGSSGKVLQQGASTITRLIESSRANESGASKAPAPGKCHAGKQTLIKHPNTEFLRDPECCAFGCGRYLAFWSRSTCSEWSRLAQVLLHRIQFTRVMCNQDRKCGVLPRGRRHLSARVDRRSRISAAESLISIHFSQW